MNVLKCVKVIALPRSSVLPGATDNDYKSG